MAYVDEVLADSPLVYLPMDALPPTKQGTYSGALAQSGVTVSADAIGDTGSFVFNGSTSWVSLADFDFTTATFSGEIWVKGGTTTSDSRILYFYPTNTNFLVKLFTNISGHIAIQYGSYSSGHKTATSSVDVHDGQWHHVVFTHNAGTLTLYVDGNQVAQQTAVGYSNNPAASKFWIGASAHGTAAGGTGNWFAGQVDNLALYESVLSPTRIAAHYAAGTAIPEPPLELETAVALATFEGTLGYTVELTAPSPIELSSGIAVVTFAAMAPKVVLGVGPKTLQAGLAALAQFTGVQGTLLIETVQTEGVALQSAIALATFTGVGPTVSLATALPPTTLYLNAVMHRAIQQHTLASSNVEATLPEAKVNTLMKENEYE